MKAPHLLRVEAPPESFAPLAAAARAAGLRLGWLELAEAAPVPEVLEAAAGLGVLRAVAVGGGRAVAVKPLRGEPVLRDILREHFLGCAAVLVRGGSGAAGEIEAPRLCPDGEGWILETPGQAGVRYGTEALAERLRSPKELEDVTPRAR